MRWVDAQVSSDQDETESGSLWGGEPPARFAGHTRQDLLQELERELRGVDILRVADSQWLAVIYGNSSKS